ncbi:MAG TPA: FkbM family methyltransferase [Opitutales bacterium]|nr:FkbM family methyltransferase [Opitutales bacterium]
MADIYNPRGYLRPVTRFARRHVKRLLRDADYAFFQKLVRQFGRWPRYQPGSFDYLGRRVEFVDAASLLTAWDEIFLNRIYDIGPQTEPYLCDAGANIGLTELYFQVHYGKFSGVCFEPDPGVFAVLQRNLRAWGCDVEARPEAVGARDGEAEFKSEGADAGQLVADGAGSHRVKITRLSPWLNRRISLLKIDIEGAEVEVMEDCAGQFGQVAALFVEFHSYPGRAQNLWKLLRVIEEAGFRVYPQEVASQTQMFAKAERKTIGAFDLNLNIFAIRPPHQ